VTSTNGVATVTAGTGATTTFKLADLRSAFAALPPAYQANATWIMSPSAFLNAAGSLDTANAPALPSLHGPEPSLFGRPVLTSPELPAAAAGARSTVVGDFSVGYAVRRMSGLGLQRQDELHSDSGQAGFRVYSRVDGRVVVPDALRILVHSAT
jgi:HK97 family phage major capsid protein